MDLQERREMLVAFKRQYVNVDKFTQVFQVLHETEFFVGSECTGVFIGGEAGVGKSTLAEKFQNELAVDSTSEQDFKPVVIASFKSDRGLAGILESILHGMGDINPERWKGTTAKLSRIEGLIEPLGIRYIFLDEFHNALPGSGLTNQSQALKLLKDLLNFKKVVVVVLGMPEAQKMVTFLDEIEQRFERCLVIEPFNCLNNINTLEFIEYLYVLLAKFPFKVNYLNCVMQSERGKELGLIEDVDYRPLFRFLLATHGKPRNIYKILSYCLLKVRDSRGIDKQLLAEAWSARINKVKGKGNPFTVNEKHLMRSLREENLHG